MSDTPRTDAIIHRLRGESGLFCDDKSLEQYNDLVDLALTMERELAGGARVVGIPQGWKLVPVEATDAMWVAGGNEIIRQYLESTWDDAKEVAEDLNAGPIWKAMLAAVLNPPVPMADAPPDDTGVAGSALNERQHEKDAPMKRPPDDVVNMLLHSGRSDFLLTVNNVNGDGSISCHIVPTPKATGYETPIAFRFPPSHITFKLPSDVAPKMDVQALKAERDNLYRCVKWYADGNHVQLEDWEAPDMPNWLCPPSEIETTKANHAPFDPKVGPPPPEKVLVDLNESWVVEDGGIARGVLAGLILKPDLDDGEEETAFLPKAADTKPLAPPDAAPEVGIPK